jgi:hypothetical protein
VLILKILDRFSGYLEKAAQISIVLSMAGIVLFVNLAVFFRYVLSDPLTWTTEIGIYRSLWSLYSAEAQSIRQSRGSPKFAAKALENVDYNIFSRADCSFSCGLYRVTIDAD